MSGFTLFSPASYPQKSVHFIAAPGAPLPTNSWASNAVKGTVYHEGDPPGTFRVFPPRSRDTKPLPWFISPYYGDDTTTEPYISLGHDTVGDVTHSTIEGRNTVAIDARGYIDRLSISSAVVGLDLTNLDDGTATYSFSNGTNVYTSRGSPFVSVSNTVTELLSLLFSSSLTLTGPSSDIARPVGQYRLLEVPFIKRQVTESATTNYGTAGVYTFSIPLRQRYATVGSVSVQAMTFGVGGNPLSGSIAVNGTTVGTFLGGQFQSTTGATYDIPSKTITAGAVQLVLGTPVFRVLNSSDVPGTVRILSTRIFTMSKALGTVALTIPAGSHLWLYTNDNRAYYNDPELGYVTGMTAAESSSGAYNVFLSKAVGSSVYLFTPFWWATDYNIGNLTYLDGSVYDVTYRECKLARTGGSVLLFSPKVALALPTLPVVPSELNLEAFKKRVLYDVDYYKRMTLDAYKLETAYVFGQNAAKYGRVLTFAQVTGILTEDMYTEFVRLLVTWLDETNGQVSASVPGSNTLVHETRWGGIITLADYNVHQGTAGEGSFGNSFYNDHHFQYGYFFAALYTLAVIGRQATLLVYEPKVRQLLQDVVTSSTDLTSIAVKTRHKDWYFGHSFATGLTDAVNIDQESVSEAINCYYQAWLLAGVMFTLTSDVRYSDMKNISEAAIYNEIAAYRAFWTQNGEVLGTPSTTIVQLFSKTFQAFAPGQPSSYPSTSLYRYSIITLPFTDITPLFIDKAWVQRIAAPTQADWLRVDRNLVAGLTNYESQIPEAWKYVPTPSPYDVDMDIAPPGITSWGFVGLQLLALGAAVEEEEALRYYNKVLFRGMDKMLPLDEDIIKRFDSFSNGFYVLYEQADYNQLTPIVGPDNELLLNQGREREGLRAVPSRVLQLREHREGSRSLSLRTCEHREGPRSLLSVGKPPIIPPRLVDVPSIFMIVTPISPENVDVLQVTYTVIDLIDYNKCNSRCKVGDQSIPTGLVPEQDAYITEFTLTQPECDITPVLNAQGTSLLQICRKMYAVAPYLIQYTYLRWILCRLMYGSFKLKYLRRGFTDKFMHDLARSRFNEFYTHYFTSLSLVDYNGLLYDVTGYGNVPQNGQLYFI